MADKPAGMLSVPGRGEQGPALSELLRSVAPVALPVHRLDKVLEGELDDFSEALAADDRRRALETASA